MPRELWELHIIIIEALTWKNGHICPQEIMRKKTKQKSRQDRIKTITRRNPRKLQAKAIR